MSIMSIVLTDAIKKKTAEELGSESMKANRRPFLFLHFVRKVILVMATNYF